MEQASGSRPGPTRRRVTARDVAREAGVAQSTVSYVLNDTPGQTIPEHTRQRVREAVDRLGYTPSAAARTLRRGRSDLVLFLLPDWPLGPAVTELLDGLERRLAARGLVLLIRRVEEGRPLVAVCEPIHPVAVVSLGVVDADEQRGLTERGIAVVAGMLRPHVALEGAIAAAHHLIAATQVQHLAATGHRHLGYAASDDPRVAVFHELRLGGARAAAFELGLPDLSVRFIETDERSAAQAISAWRSEDAPVTAVCAYNDETAFTLIAGLRSLGLRAPDDLAVIGVDDIPLAPFAGPALTTIRQDSGALAEFFAEAVLADLSSTPRPAPPAADAFTLVVRDSA